LSDGFNRYLFEYRYEGAEWALEICARDLDDAKARLKAIPWARLKGEVAFSGRVPGGSLLLRIARALGLKA
jgi:hypothetical protein